MRLPATSLSWIRRLGWDADLRFRQHRRRALIGGWWLNERWRGLGNGPWVEEGSTWCWGSSASVAELKVLTGNQRRFYSVQVRLFVPLGWTVRPSLLTANVSADASLRYRASSFRTPSPCSNTHSRCGALFRLEQSHLVLLLRR